MRFMNAAMKKVRDGFARAFLAILVNTEFFEDSVTRSQGLFCTCADAARSSCKQQEKNRGEAEQRHRRGAGAGQAMPAARVRE
jgi:hypothetical protein